MSNRLVSIIVVTAGKKDYIWGVLGSVKKQTYPFLETIVIANSLNANLGKEILKSYPLARLYQSQENIFYCGALNLGIKQSKGDFILCLNDDITLEPDFITKALGGFYIGRKIGMVSPKILRSDKKTVDSAGLLLGLAYTAVERGYGTKDRGQFDKPGYIFGVNGAAAFYRREMLEDIREDGNYFDPDFRIFYEDLDLAWRAERRGWRGYYMPGAVAYHIRGGTVRASGGAGRPFARRYLADRLQTDLIKNRYLAIIRNESPLKFIAHLPLMLLYDFTVWAYILMFNPRLIKKIVGDLKYLKAAFIRRVKR